MRTIANRKRAVGEATVLLCLLQCSCKKNGPKLSEEIITRDLEDLNESLLSDLLHACPKVDVFLIGWGRYQGQLNMGLNKALREAGIGVDVMNCGAACRTYNVLVLEGRQVAAALFPL